MAKSTISGAIHMFNVCSFRTLLVRFRGLLRAHVGYRCVEGRWWLNIGWMDGSSSDSLYGMVIGAVMLVLVGGSGVVVTGVEYFVTCFVGVWGTWIGASCTYAGCGRIFVFGTGRDDDAVSKIVAIFLSAARWSVLVDVVNSGKGCLSAFTNSLAAANILIFGDNICAATSVGKNCAVAQVLILPVDGKKIYNNGGVQVPGLGNMLHHHELRNSPDGLDPCIVMLWHQVGLMELLFAM